ncbi:PREDICTED: reverse mRNAase [Prunus dulcis]|uniref:PREDICTED: reverse mRNAase n=1 Tax=Prunus dulcis TaxID=3755 RepID=A0A5E4GBJ2_PRUDU|nr:PREDICTED: reverse mRNAase [Prunus dulcis]
MDAKDDVPWVVMGDLNEVAWHLVDFMADNNLMDLGYKGHIFTWERSLGISTFVTERLDRALSNSFWLEKWPNTTVTICTRIGSDHSPLPIITQEMNPNLTDPFTEDEILAASKELGALKAPGPESFPSIFYHKFWSTMKKEVIGTTKDMYIGLSNLQDLNQTHIALIPKVAAPDKANQFRPISLCNSSYKILSKILANRLKSILPLIISENQNAFLQERQIQDNIILAHEAFHHLRNPKKKKEKKKKRKEKRDLAEFKLALLGKQSWQILNNPNAYWVRVLKVRYFPSEDFWQAKVGHRASWAWASLIASRDFLISKKQSKKSQLVLHLRPTAVSFGLGVVMVSIKSGCHYLHSETMAISTLLANSSRRVHPLVWKGIWKIKTLPKIKFFC